MVPPALDCPPSTEPVAVAFEWNPASQNHTPWCTVKERCECCIRQGAHGAEEQPCPGIRTNLHVQSKWFVGRLNPIGPIKDEA